MSDRPWNRDWQFSAGVKISEKYIRDRLSGFLSQIPALNDSRNVSRNVADRIWPPVEENDDRRFAGLDNSLDQVILHSEQLKAGSVSKMNIAPCFTRSLLVVAENQNHSICFPGGVNCFCNEFSVIIGVRKRDDVLLPGAADSVLTSLTIEHGEFLARFFLNPLQHRSKIFRFAAVASQQFSVCVRTDHRKRTASFHR